MPSKVIDPIVLGLEVTGLSGVEAHCKCPFHGDTKQSASFNVEKGAFFCFACKKVSTTAEIARLLGSRIEMVNLDQLKIPQRPTDRPDWRWVLSAKMAYGNSYLKSRGVSDAQVAEFSIREYDEGVVFPLKARNGEIIGAQIRLYKGHMKYIFAGDRPPLYPIDRLGESSSVVLVEGIFGALRARKYGYSAFALMSAAVVAQAIPWIAGFRSKICVFDNDEAGRSAAQVLLNANIGVKAFMPGAEADEMEEPFWSTLEDKGKLITHFDNFMI